MSRPREPAVEAWLARLASELRGRCNAAGEPLDVELLVEELRDHLAAALEDGLARGRPRPQAVREALQRVGPVGSVARSWGERRAARRGAPGRWEAHMESLLLELRQAVRGLARTPGYTAAFVLTLALGVGANAAIFSAVDAVLLEPLPYAHSERLVYLRHAARQAGFENALFSVPEIADYRRDAPSLDGVAEFSSLTFTLLGLDQPRRVRAGIVTGNYFDVMGLAAALGRTLSAADDRPDTAPVAVLTHPTWQRMFGGDPGVLGRVLQMNGRGVELVGVARPAPPWPEETDLYTNMAASPHHLSASMTDDRMHRMTEVFARLAPGASLAAARDEVEAITQRLHREYPDAYDPSQGYAVGLTPLRDQLGARARPTLLVLLGVTALILVIACANVANLILARVLRRRQELAVRASLGASPLALRRQLLAETLLPSLAGALLGWALAWGGAELLARWVARYTVRASEIAVDARVFGVCLALGLLAAGLFALLPRLPGSDPRVAAGRATAGLAARRTQRALVVAQVALSFAVLAGAGLLLRTLYNLQRDSGGLELEEVLSLEVPITGQRSPEQRLRFYETLLERSAALPGVASAAFGGRVPLRGAPSGLSAFLAALELEIESQPLAPGAPLPRADFRPVSSRYFDTLGLLLEQGRALADSDDAESARVVVINRAMARHHFGDRDPVGHRLAWRGDVLRFIGVDAGWRRIVGVVSDTADYGVGRAAPHIAYLPWAQEPSGSVLFLRTPAAASVARAALGVVRELDPDQPVENVATLAQVHGEAIAPQRLNATLVGAFGLLALALAAVGIGGVLAFAVGERTRELGVRAALGANRSRLLRLVLAEGAALALLGLLLGGALTLLSAQAVAGLLFGVPPRDPVTLSAVALALLATALLASWLPAARAAGIDPVRALRAE